MGAFRRTSRLALADLLRQGARCKGSIGPAGCARPLDQHALTHEPGIGYASALMLAALVLQAPAQAATLSGSASIRERISLPPDAVFEAVLIDAAIADAPARQSERTPVVEGFVGAPPGKTCDQAAQASPAPAPLARPELRGTLWRLQALPGGNTPTLLKPPGKAAELQLAADSERVSGSGGCNRLMGGFQLGGEQLRFSRLASTQMACPPEVMAYERRVVAALEQVRRWSIDTSNLLLQDGRGRTLLLFQPTP